MSKNRNNYPLSARRIVRILLHEKKLTAQFELEEVMITQAAEEQIFLATYPWECMTTEIDVYRFLARHATGDCGDVVPEEHIKQQERWATNQAFLSRFKLATPRLLEGYAKSGRLVPHGYGARDGAPNYIEPCLVISTMKCRSGFITLISNEAFDSANRTSLKGGPLLAENKIL